MDHIPNADQLVQSAATEIPSADGWLKAQSSASFCIYPFTHLATKTDGSLKLCCRSWPIANVKDQGAVSAWNGEDYRRVRRQMLAGERPKECEDCWKMEDLGARSMRQRALNPNSELSRWSQYKADIAKCSVDGSVPYFPRTLELKLSNYCNLRCRMCHPLDSTAWAKEWPLVEDLAIAANNWSDETARRYRTQLQPHVSGFENNSQWWEDFDELVDHVDLIEFAGGEPLLDPMHYLVLEKLQRRASQISLKYSTNLTRLEWRGRSVLDHWSRFKSVSIFASVDGIGETYEYIRTGAKFTEVKKNLESLLNNKTVQFDEIAIACTIQIYNVFQLPEIFDFFGQMGVHVHTHRVSSPSYLCVQALPQTLKAALTTDGLAYLERLKLSNANPAHISNVTKHFNDHLNFMNGADTHQYSWPAFVEYTKRLDRSRGTSLQQTVYGLSNYLTDKRVATNFGCI